MSIFISPIISVIGMVPVAASGGETVASIAPLLTALEVSYDASEAGALYYRQVLHATLVPLLPREELLTALGLDDTLLAELEAYLSVGAEEATPSEELIAALLNCVDTLRTAIVAAQFGITMTEVQARLAAEAAGEGARDSAPEVTRPPLVYAAPDRAAHLAAQRGHVLERVHRLFEMAEARAGVRSNAIPPAWKLTEVLANPVTFKERLVAFKRAAREGRGIPHQDTPEERAEDETLEIVLFDVDGTTRFGQMYLEWLFVDLVRYGPKSQCGKTLLELIGVMRGALRFRKEEVETGGVGGEAGEQRLLEFVAQGLQGVDLKLVEASLDRWYDNYGGWGINPYMRDEFAFHRTQGRLLLGVSASPEYVVKKHMRDLGLPEDNGFGTIVREKAAEDPETHVTQKIIDLVLMRHETKVKWLEQEVFAPLRAAGIKFRVKAAYSDSKSDDAMLALAQKDGGTAVATRPPQADFAAHVLKERGGIVVRAEPQKSHDRKRSDRPRDAHVQVTTLFEDMGLAVSVSEVVPASQLPWRDKVVDYAEVARDSAAAFALIAGVATAAMGFVEGGLEGIDTMTVLAKTLLAASGGAGGALVARLFTPQSGSVSERRRWLMEHSTPLLGAMMFSDMFQGLSVWAALLAFSGLVLGGVASHFANQKLGVATEGDNVVKRSRRWFASRVPLLSALTFLSIHPSFVPQLIALGSVFATGKVTQQIGSWIGSIRKAFKWGWLKKSSEGFAGELVLRTAQISAYGALGLFASRASHYLASFF